MTTLSYSRGMVFQRSDKWNCGEITVTPRLLRVLAAVDGSNSLAAIADDCGFSFEDVVKEIQRLERLDIIKGSLHNHDHAAAGGASVHSGYLEPDYETMVKI